jgi:hypothetical protein
MSDPLSHSEQNHICLDRQWVSGKRMRGLTLDPTPPGPQKFHAENLLVILLFRKEQMPQ